MPKAIFLCLFALLTASPTFAKSVTVEQLSREIASSRKKSDSKIAGRLYNLQLTERLSAQKLSALETALPGPKSRRALVALADLSEFIGPPAAEIPNRVAPSLDQQRAIIAKAVDYATATLHQLPDLFARRDTIRYQDSPPGLRVVNSDSASGTFVPYQPLHPVSRSIATVLYQHGREVVRAGTETNGTSTSSATGLTTAGEFGPIFSVVFGDLPKGKLAWSHWEQGTTSPAAVFRFEIPQADSHYYVEFCCISGSVFKQFSAYHGELTLDPVSGTILRLTLIADLSKRDPLTKAELMVEYGPVVLGRKTYFCPVRSISVSVAPMQGTQQGGAPVNLNQSPMYMRGVPTVVNNGRGGGEAPLQTMLNEVVFDQYHLFRADVRILTASDAPPNSTHATAAKASSESANTTESPVKQPAFTDQNPASAPPVSAAASMSAGANPGSAKTPNGSAEVSSASPSVRQITPLAAAAPSSNTGISVGKAAPLPETSAMPPPTSVNPGFSLHLNSRLVDIGVTAYDKKGRPVINLTSSDFVIYDNDRKEALRAFSQAGAASAGLHPPSPQAQSVTYSNRLDAMGSTQPTSTVSPESSTILLLDPTNLDFADLTYAREQILKFLDRLRPSEPIGLYVRTGSGFRILDEETTDHAAVNSALREWMPSAQDLARAQEEERRNHQQFDTVESPEDMQYVNGNVGGMITPDSNSPSSSGMGATPDIPGAGASTTMDPNLMREGMNPAREALAALVAIAAHMNAIPGHKDLVWVAGDNVLANWSDQAAGTDKGPHHIASFSMGAQEALNDARVSLYPLDASQLETAATDASLQNNSVQLNPASLNPTNVGGVDEMEGGRSQAQMRQDLRAVQPAMQQMAQATGGRAFRRSDNLIADLNSVVADGHAEYLLSFSPDTPPDGRYHHITVTVPTRSGLTLRYRAGYLYTKEPATLKDRLKQAVWQPQDETAIGLSAHWDKASEGEAVSLQIAAGDVSLAQQGGRWTDKLDVFLVQHDQTGTRAELKEQTLALNLKSDTYQKVLRDGIPFAEYIAHQQQTSGTIRIIVVDENSERMGSITLPLPLLRASR